jgi:hypothetical protein
MNKIVSEPNTNKTSPNFRMSKEQKDKLKEHAKLKGYYIQEYMDMIFDNLDKIDNLIFE